MNAKHTYVDHEKEFTHQSSHIKVHQRVLMLGKKFISAQWPFMVYALLTKQEERVSEGGLSKLSYATKQEERARVVYPSFLMLIGMC